MRVHYKGSSTFCCNSDAPCAEHAEKYPPAQSDAPSARKFSGSDAEAWWWENVKSSPFKMTPERIWAHCEAYAALRTAQQDSQLKLTRVELKQSCEERERLLATERAKVAQLERERDAAELFRSQMQEALGCDTSEGTSWFGTGLLERARTLVQRESALSEARERAQALADWLEWKQRHSAERAQQYGEQGSDQVKTFNLGMVDCVQSVIQTDEYRQLRQLLAGASAAAGKEGAG